MKALVLLKMSKLPYDTAYVNFKKAPKGKGPYMRDGDEIIPDSTFIRFHLEDKHNIDFDPGLNDEQKAIAWAFEKLCEDHLYFAILHERWIDDDNFNRGPVEFFKRAPALIRPFIIRKVRSNMKNVILHGHGMGRHSPQEITRLASRGIKSISDFLGDKQYLFGDEPCGADAMVFSSVAGLLCDRFVSQTRDNAEKFENLKAYRDRGMKRWFPEFADKT